MAKIEKKSIAELVAMRTKKPSLDQIDQITQNIHTAKAEANQVAAGATSVEENSVMSEKHKTADTAPEKVSPKAKIEKAAKTIDKAPKQNVVAKEEDFDDRIKRISVHAPIGLYIQARTKATLKNMTMMAYILKLMEEDLKK